MSELNETETKNLINTIDRLDELKDINSDSENNYPDDYHYFTDEDAEEMARLNPQYANWFNNEEMKQAMRDVYSGKVEFDPEHN